MMPFDYSLSLDDFQKELQQIQFSDLANHLWQPTASPKIEVAFITALSNYFEQAGYSQAQILAIINQLQNKPIIQTAHHITPTNGPTFLGIDILSLAKKNPQDYYLVATNSGVSFSNTAWSGCLSYGQLEIEQLIQKNSKPYGQIAKSIHESQLQGSVDVNKFSLILSKYRDALVYNKLICDVFNENFNAVVPSLHCFPKPSEFKFYTEWAIAFSTKLQKEILNDDSIIYFDINAIINLYLIDILSNQADHPVTKLFFDVQFEKDETPLLFLKDRIKKGSYKVEKIDATQLRQDYSRESLIATLQEKKICCSTFLLYFILNAIQNLCCLGSFMQYQYIQKFIKTWAYSFPELEVMKNQEQFYRYCYYRATIKNQEIYPLDLWIKKEKFNWQAFLEKKSVE